jgi:hypothetical protein
MNSMTTTSATPSVGGFYGGQQIQFIHTEASDPGVEDMLTRMMGAKVVLVPSLGQIPSPLLGDVFVFTNGVNGGGPMGFQPDVFSSVPGDVDYTPLRAINLVTWKQSANAIELKSSSEIRDAVSKGQLELTRPGIVVNMPIISWPGGHR